MNKLSQLVNTKLKLVTFVIMPLIILLLIISMVYLSFFTNNEPQTQEQVTSSSLSPPIIKKEFADSSQGLDSQSIKSFDELNVSSVAQSKASASVTALTSPVASNIIAELIEVNKNLEAIESVVDGADQDLDNQILNN
jgi:hypothetical protein